MKHIIFRFFILLFAILSLLLPQLGHAASKSINIEINKGVTMRLTEPAQVVSVADPAIADVQVLAPDLISIQGTAVGQTSITAYGNGNDEILNGTITVSHNISRLKALIKRVMPDANVQFDSVDGALIISGEVDSPLESENIRRLATPFLTSQTETLVNMLNVRSSNQVMLRVRVAEVSRSELKRFGINLNAALFSGGQFAFGLVNGRDITPGNNGVLPRVTGVGAATAALNSGDADISSVIDALAEDNMIKLLAEPNLTTSSGKAANFLAGGEFPVPVPADEGQVTIEWRQYGVGLQFTPEIVSANKISLHVLPEVSELSEIGSVDVQGFTIPSITTRRAETTVELGSGESFAVAGLLRHNTGNNISKFPWLGDVPIIGTLFRSREYQNNQSELVIIVTPYIVRGTSRDKIMDPAKGLHQASDAEQILQGQQFHDIPAEKPVTAIPVAPVKVAPVMTAPAPVTPLTVPPSPPVTALPPAATVPSVEPRSAPYVQKTTEPIEASNTQESDAKDANAKEWHTQILDSPDKPVYEEPRYRPLSPEDRRRNGMRLQ